MTDSGPVSGATLTAPAVAGFPPRSAPDVRLRLYGLDIETDTARGGLDPLKAGVIAVALCGAESGETESVSDVVLTVTGSSGESRLLSDLDERLAELEPGILVTWNGSAFDLPFLGTRAHICGVDLGLRIFDRWGRPAERPRRSYAHSARWYGHRHLDALRAYRSLTAGTGLSCGLKAVARRHGLDPVDEIAGMVHLLDEARLRRYVASDARAARTLAVMNWETAESFVDDAPSGVAPSAVAPS